MKRKLLLFIILIFIIPSCKSYQEYTIGTNKLEYTFHSKKLKRYSNIFYALIDPLSVEFIDLNLYNITNKEEVLYVLNENIYKFKNLKKLVITSSTDFNVSFPMNILKHQSIEFLVLQSWRGLGTEIFKGLPQLKNLIFLGLPNCQLNKLPLSICTIEKLQGLDIHANCIENVPDEIEQLKDLRTIDLSNNGLRGFPIELSYCKRLEYLDINNAEGNNV